jgi:hypothetical protein
MLNCPELLEDSVEKVFGGKCVVTFLQGQACLPSSIIFTTKVKGYHESDIRDPVGFLRATCRKLMAAIKALDDDLAYGQYVREAICGTSRE